MAYSIEKNTHTEMAHLYGLYERDQHPHPVRGQFLDDRLSDLVKSIITFNGHEPSPEPALRCAVPRCVPFLSIGR